MRIPIYFLLISFVCLPVQAISLFGIELQQASRDQFRIAVKNSGARLISQAGDADFFDIYNSEKLIQGSSQMYLGFVKKDNRLAFVEYEFKGLQPPHMLRLLTQKYGQPKIPRSQFFSDKRYQWKVDGVEIVLYQNWSTYSYRLVYLQPERLSELRQEYRASSSRMIEKKPTDMDLAY